MALEQKLHLKLAQKLVMTPTLQQAIKLLQLSRLELEQTLNQELQTNPLLELQEESPGADEGSGTAEGEPGAAPAEGSEAGQAELADTKEKPDSFGEVEIEALFANYLHDSPSTAATWDNADEAPLENSPTREPSLFEALEEQLSLIAMPAALRQIAVFVVGNLDSAGYLRTSDEDLAAQLGVETASVVEAIAWVQRLDPPGIGARSLQECFLLQLDRIEVDEDSKEALAIARRLVAEALDDLLHQRWDRILQGCGIDNDEVRAALAVIRRLDPRPGTALGPAENSMVEPDVVVTKVNDEWRVSLDDEGLPRLRLSPRYIRMLQSRAVDGETTGYLREKMRGALWFLRSVEQRQNTILRVATAIVKRQRDFLEKGMPYLRPLVLRDIADDIGMHESTVSRVVANKFIATPRGVVPLKYFFHSSISHAVQGDISSVVVKQRIRELIAVEELGRPLSDARVARQLNRLGIRIARRTVAKYREELGIPSSEQRRRALR